MKTIIAGSRDIDDYPVIVKALEDSGFVVTEVVSGGARGVDQLGEVWARQHKLPVKQFLAAWDELGKKAGGVRNQKMADYADACVVAWNGTSKGSADMIRRAKTKGLYLHVYEVKPPEATPFAGI